MPTCTLSASLSFPAGRVPHTVNNTQFSLIQDYQSPDPNLTATGKQKKQYLVREHCSQSIGNCRICSCFQVYILMIRILCMEDYN